MTSGLHGVLAATTVATRTNAGTTWSATCTALSDGAHTLKVTVTDAVGNATTSAAIPVVIDTMGPTVSIAPGNERLDGLLYRCHHLSGGHHADGCRCEDHQGQRGCRGDGGGER